MAALQLVFYGFGVEAHDVMDTGRIEEEALGHLGKSRNDVLYTVNNRFFHRAVVELVLFDDDGREFAQSLGFGSRQNRAAQTAQAAEMDLVRLRHLHGHVDDIPRTAGRRSKLQGVVEGLGEFRVTHGDDGIRRVLATIDFLQHGITPLSAAPSCRQHQPAPGIRQPWGYPGRPR